MKDDLFTFLVGGKAGEGIKKAGNVVAELLASMGRRVFEMDDYQSLIRGGHNFSVISSATRKVYSHYMRANVLALTDQRSVDLHRDHISDNGVLIYDSDRVEDVEGGIGVPMWSETKGYDNRSLMLGVGAVGALTAAIGHGEGQLGDLIEAQYPRGTDDNVAYATRIHGLVKDEVQDTFELSEGDRRRRVMSGNEAIALGAAAGGLDMYYAYPMTPASSILHFLARYARELGLAVVHAENEIGVMNMAIGSAVTGARVMVGSSGGGFALMEEAFSLAGMAEVPLLAVLSSRPGPSTGVPTYTEQADLNFALNQGHGDFPRIVASPGTIQEAFYLAARLLFLTWRFQTPAILLTEKHLSESSMTVETEPEKAKWPVPKMNGDNDYNRYEITRDGISPLEFPPSKGLIKWNSYEHDETGLTTEDPEAIVRMHDKRLNKGRGIERYLREKHCINIFGNGEARIFTYGSTTMSILEALVDSNIDATLVQVLFLEPFPAWEMEDLVGDEKIVAVEQSSTGQFARLLRERGGLNVDHVIKKYDGRPFDPRELGERLREVV